MVMVRPSRKRWLASGGILLAGASLLAFLLVRHSKAASPDGLVPLRFVQTPGLTPYVRYSPDGRLVLTTGGDDDHPLLTFRDSATGAVVRQWPGGRGEQWLSPNGKWLLNTEPSEDGPTLCILRDAVSGRVLRRWTGQIMDVRPDFRWMVTCDDLIPLPSPPGNRDYIRPKVGRVVDVLTGRVLGRFPLPKISYGSARLSRTSPYLSLSNDDEAAALLRVPEMTPALKGLPPLQSLRVSRDGTCAFGVSDTGTLHLWRLPSCVHASAATGLGRATWVAEGPGGVLVVQGTSGFSPDQRNVVQVRSADGMRLLRSLPGYAEAFSPDLRLIGFQDYRPAVGHAWEVWDCTTGRRLARLDTNADVLGQPGSRYFPDQGHLDIAPDGRHCVLSTSDGMLRFYDLSHSGSPSGPVSTESGRVLLSFGDSRYAYPADALDAVMLPDGDVAAVGRGADGRGQVQIWRPGGKSQMVSVPDAAGDGERLGVSPDGTTLAGSSQGGTWTLGLAGGGLQTSRPASAAEQAGRPVWLDGSAQPPALVSNGDYGNGPLVLTRWDAAAGRMVARTILPQQQTLGGRELDLAGTEPSPDGQRLAVLWNETDPQAAAHNRPRQINWNGILELRDTRSGRLLRTLASTRLHANVQPRQGALDRPVFSPDGTRLAAADDEGVVQVWDTATGRKLGQVAGTLVQSNGRRVAFANLRRGTRLAFTADGQSLAVARDDNSLYLYSLRTWLPVAQIGKASERVVNGVPQPSFPLRWLALSPDGRTLYGTALNGSDVRAWDVPKLTP